MLLMLLLLTVTVINRYVCIYKYMLLHVITLRTYGRAPWRCSRQFFRCPKAIGALHLADFKPKTWWLFMADAHADANET